MKIVVVDNQDVQLGVKDTKSLLFSDIYRVSALWVTNSQGDILLAQRHHSKKKHPGKWGTAVAGTVEEGETYEENMYKEAYEELGIEGQVFQLGPKTGPDGEYKHFTQWYRVTLEKIYPFVLQETEVEAIQWISQDEMVEWIETSPGDFTPGMMKYAKLFFGRDK